MSTDKDSQNSKLKLFTVDYLQNEVERGTETTDGNVERAASKRSILSEEEEEEEPKSKTYDVDLIPPKPLPERYGKVPKAYLGKPIVELDPAREDEQTFMVVGERFGGKTSLYRFSASKALFCFSPINPVRRLMLLILTHRLFDIFVILTILVNCIFLAMDVPRPEDEDVPIHLEIAEYLFTTIYSIEMMVKVIARGFVLKEFTYLRDPWNWLDFLVILLAYITFCVSLFNVEVGDFTALRAFRVLRALKTISVVPGLKSIINALLRSMKMLGEVMVLTFFILSIFALLSLQVYMGTLKQKCVASIDITDINETEEYYNSYIANETNWFMLNGDPLVCSNITGIG
ncbi:sodium channel protein type 4 subunit alpha B-like [Antedon mediterranea]|uniref:sodium channel protein type 4 subunit alpha B-like n=1 Tax=Antedon mediterranea TaxID=105859 RepID=UPI003AF68022